MRDAWLLVGAAVIADRPREARTFADRAVEVAGWDRYLPLGSIEGVDLWGYEHVPRGWAYYARVGRYGRMLLIHPDASAFLTQTVGFHRVREAAEECPGLVRLDQLLAPLLAMQVPDAPDF